MCDHPAPHTQDSRKQQIDEEAAKPTPATTLARSTIEQQLQVLYVVSVLTLLLCVHVLTTTPPSTTTESVEKGYRGGGSVRDEARTTAQRLVIGSF